MSYLDASVLVALIVPEPSSRAVRQWFDKTPSETRLVSDWCLTESVSALGMKVRMREMPAPELSRAKALLWSMVSASFELVTPRRIDFEVAADFLTRSSLGLRAGDALHLAVAIGAAAGPLVTLDRKMIRAARALELEAVDPRA